MDDMMTKIVAAAVERLKLHLKDVNEFDISKDFSNIISWPSIAAVIERIGVEKGTGAMTGGSWNLRPVLSIYMVFKAVIQSRRPIGSGFSWGVRVVGAEESLLGISIWGEGANWNREPTPPPIPRPRGRR